jgi:hypothetical protein
MKKFIEKIRTFILLALPMGLYVHILKKHPKACERLQTYAGIVGNNPISYVVYNDVILIDLSNMSI